MPGTPTPAETRLPSPRLLGGRYVLGEALGSGGMGTVWRAHDKLLNRPVAVKEIHPVARMTPEEQESLRARSLNEARAAARIRSPGAVTVYDVVEEDGRPWIVMELVEARSLAEVLKTDGPVPTATAAQIGLAVLEALCAAHAAGVVHRDVKPANVLMAFDGRIALTDFGVATLDGDAGTTATGTVLGSPAYMAPERAKGIAPSPAMDMWGLGATLFAAVQGRGPFSRSDALTTLHAVIAEPVPPADRAGLMRPVIEGLLERDPARRLSAPAVRMLLAEVLRQDAAGATQPMAVNVLDITELDTAAIALSTLPAQAPPTRSGPVTEVRVLPPGEEPITVVSPSLRVAPALMAGAEPPAALPAGAAEVSVVGSAPTHRAWGVPVVVAEAPPVVDGEQVTDAAPASQRWYRHAWVALVAVLMPVILGGALWVFLGDDGREPVAQSAGAGAALPRVRVGSLIPTAGTPSVTAVTSMPAAVSTSAAPVPPVASASPTSVAPTPPAPVPDVTSSPVSPSASASPTASVETPTPAGNEFRSPAGFALTVPTGWVARATGSGAAMFQPGEDRQLLVRDVALGGDGAGATPLERAMGERVERAQRQLPGYQTLSLTYGTAGATKVANWSFTWMPGAGDAKRVDTRTAQLPNGDGYSMYVTADDAAWGDSSSVLDAVWGSFRLTDR